MSLSKELDNLLYWSQKASSVQFHKQKNKAVEHDLEHVKKRKLLRDAKPTEYNLKGLCESDKSIARKFEEEIASLETITIDKKDIEHRLQLLLDMSDMSGNPDIRNMTQHQLHQYQMMEARLEELRTIHEQNDRDIETLKNLPDHLDITDQDMGTHSQELQQQTEKSKQLEAQLTEKRAKLAELRKSKAEHQQINHKLRTIQFDHYKHTEKDQHLATLKRDIKEKKQALEELSSKQKHKTYIETLIDQLNVCLHDTKDAVDASHLLQAFTTVKQQLEQPHTSFKSCDAYRPFLNYVVDCTTAHPLDKQHFARLFPYYMDQAIHVPEERQVKARILLKLMDDGDMPLTDLTDFIESFAQEKELDTKEASQCIHKLVGQQLIRIDHTETDSIVTLLL